MDTDNEADVVAAPTVAPEIVGDAEAPDGYGETARLRDAITRKIRNPLSENRQSATSPPSKTPTPVLPPRVCTPSPRTPTPTPILPPRVCTPSPRTPTPTPILPPRSTTPSPRTPTPQPVSNEPGARETVAREPATKNSATIEVAPAPLQSRPPEPGGQRGPAPDHARMLEHSGNIHLFSLVPDAAPSPTPAKQKHKGLIVIAAVMVCGVVGNVALWRKSGDRGKPAQTIASPAEEQAPVLPVREAPPVPGSLAPTIAPLPEGCHLEITVQEAGAQLVLDGNVAAGNQIKLDVPKDDKLHVVEASAPGFLPFKRTVSFSTDVFLTISLQKQRSPAPKRDLTAGVKLDGRHADDQGMSPRSSGAKRPASKIDEDDPYAP